MLGLMLLDTEITSQINTSMICTKVVVCKNLAMLSVEDLLQWQLTCVHQHKPLST